MGDNADPHSVTKMTCIFYCLGNKEILPEEVHVHGSRDDGYEHQHGVEVVLRLGDHEPEHQRCREMKIVYFDLETKGLNEDQVGVSHTVRRLIVYTVYNLHINLLAPSNINKSVYLDTEALRLCS